MIKEAQFMRIVRLFLFLSALLIILTIGGDGLSSTTQVAQSYTSPSIVIPKAALPVTGEVTAGVTAGPLRLIIPRPGINAPVESVGVLPGGYLATPTQSPWEHAGWYASGPLPGERGSAVIDGHLDRPGGYPAVFWHLRYMQIGEKVIVIGANGKRLVFHVTRIAFYSPEDAPVQEIFGDTSGIYLNLITCAGDWIPSQHQTTLRLVIYTSLD